MSRLITSINLRATPGKWTASTVIDCDGVKHLIQADAPSWLDAACLLRLEIDEFWFDYDAAKIEAHKKIRNRVA